MLPLLPAYSAMMPVLRARESLARIFEIAVGTGSVKKSFARRVITELRFDAKKHSRREKPIRPATKEEHHAILASVGVKVVGSG